MRERRKKERDEKESLHIQSLARVTQNEAKVIPG
jgi:hypothetical protein